jgi:hypothetical protein
MTQGKEFHNGTGCPIATILTDKFGEGGILVGVQHINIDRAVYMLDTDFDYDMYSNVKDGYLTFRTTARRR